MIYRLRVKATAGLGASRGMRYLLVLNSNDKFTKPMFSERLLPMVTKTIHLWMMKPVHAREL